MNYAKKRKSFEEGNMRFRKAQLFLFLGKITEFVQFQSTIVMSNLKTHSACHDLDADSDHSHRVVFCACALSHGILAKRLLRFV